jgi:hypothetical protein
VGLTLACGTGTCAAVAAAHAWGEVGRQVRVHNPGGPLDVTLGDTGIELAGPTQWVADVEVADSVLAVLAEAEESPSAAGAVSRVSSDAARVDGRAEVSARP